MVYGLVRRVAATVIAAGALSGCAAMYDPDGFWNSATFWEEGKATDTALVAYAKGDLPKAEQSAAEALRRNPKDPYSLLAMALVNQATGRTDLAKQYYEAIVALRPQGVSYVGLPPGMQGPQPIFEIARGNIAMIEGRAMPMAAPRNGAMARQAGPGAGAARYETSKTGSLSQDLPVFEGVDGAAANRFVILKRLYDEQLITYEEYQKRRQANIGALLPMTAKPGAAGLNRVIPAGDQIVERLRALAQSLESRSITPREHVAERDVILEGLMPAAPKVTEPPPSPPTNMLQAAQRVGFLTRLQEAGLISEGEMAKEKAAINAMLDQKMAEEAARTPRPMAIADTMADPETGADASPAAPQSAAPQPVAAGPIAAGPSMGIHLASFRTEEQARTGWAKLQAKHPDLSSLRVGWSRVDLGPGKGVFFRVIGGPLSLDDARKMCTTMKLRRQFCEPAAFPAG